MELREEKARRKMTLPSEEHYTLTKIVPEFLRDLRNMKAKDMRKRDIDADISRCLRHYPFSINIDKMYEARGVCEHGRDKQWCRDCNRKGTDEM